MRRILAPAALVLAAGCALDGTRVVDSDERYPVAVKPEGVRIERDETREMGPPPPGYIRIVGHPVPGWEPGQPQARANPMSWTFIGPMPIANEYWSGNANAGGRVVCIAPHPTDSNTCYIVSASGGLWKTTNGGTTWTPKTDELSVLNGGFVAIAPSSSSTIFLGTGEYQQGSAGDGVFKSTDAGDTWTRIATAAQVGDQVCGLAVSPTSSSTIHVCGSKGYSRSTNGGSTWTTVLTGAASCLRTHPTDGNIVYVARAGNGMWKSTNAGSSFTKLAGGLPTSGFSRIVFDISKSTPTTLFAAFITGGGALQGLYKTTDSGATWTKQTACPDFCNPQGWYDAYVGIDPTNADKVYCGGVDPRYPGGGVVRTTNGGASWTEISDGPVSGQLHPDHHFIAWGASNVLWESNDGGIWKSTNGGDSWTNLNSTLAAAQLYDVALHKTNANKVLGGTQDNGTPGKTTSALAWPQTQTGDGGFSEYDFNSSTRYYTTYVYLNIYRWSNNVDTDITGPWGSDPTNWISPLVMAPSTSTTLFGGTNRVWRTTNATAGTPTWTAISTTAVSGGGTLNAIAVSYNSSSTIWTGSTTGKVYVTTNASTWNDRSAGLPAGQVSDIILDPGNGGIGYVAFYNSSGPRVLRSTNYGSNWTDVTGTLPAGVSAQALEIDFEATPHRMFVGSGAGAYASLDGGVTWVKDGADLPNVNVSDLAIDHANRTITAGTYGRGAWRSPLPPICPADFNHDGFLTGDDFDGFVVDFEAGC